jgi:hypothetical protein
MTERGLDVVEHLERLHPRAVVLVDEGEQRDAARAGHLEQPQGLRLDAPGRVEQHDRGVGGGEHPQRVSEKSRCPGVSSRLWTMPWCSKRSTVEVTEIPRVRSICIQSEVTARRVRLA